MDFGSGIPGYDPSLFQYSKAIKSLKKGASYESSIDDRYTVRVGDSRHGVEQHRTFLRSTSKFSGARSCKESSGGRRNLSLLYSESEPWLY